MGDGQLPHPGMETIFETYYSWHVQKIVTISPDYQFIANPEYNRKRGPVNIFQSSFTLSVDYWESHASPHAHALPFSPFSPSLAMTGTIASPARGSAHHQPNTAFMSKPPNRIAER